MSSSHIQRKSEIYVSFDKIRNILITRDDPANSTSKINKTLLLNFCIVIGVIVLLVIIVSVIGLLRHSQKKRALRKALKKEERNKRKHNVRIKHLKNINENEYNSLDYYSNIYVDKNNLKKVDESDDLDGNMIGVPGSGIKCNRDRKEFVNYDSKKETMISIGSDDTIVPNGNGNTVKNSKTNTIITSKSSDTSKTNRSDITKIFKNDAMNINTIKPSKSDFNIKQLINNSNEKLIDPFRYYKPLPAITPSNTLQKEVLRDSQVDSLPPVYFTQKVYSHKSLPNLSRPSPGISNNAELTSKPAELSTSFANNAELPTRPANNAELSIRPANNAELPIRPANNAELPIRPANNAELPTRPANNAELPIRPANNAELPTRPANNAKLSTKPESSEDSYTSEDILTGLNDSWRIGDISNHYDPFPSLDKDKQFNSSIYYDAHSENQPDESKKPQSLLDRFSLFNNKSKDDDDTQDIGRVDSAIMNIYTKGGYI